MQDYIIVGSGLSGVTLAHFLRRKGYTFTLISDYSQQSSIVAGGIMNPIVLKKFTLAWQGNLQLKKATAFYRTVEKELAIDILKFYSIYRRFNSIKEQNDWFAALDKPYLSDFLGENLVSNIPNIQSNYSFGKMEGAGILDTNLYLKESINLLQKENAFQEEKFNYKNLLINADHVSYKNTSARKIIFAEGFGVMQNPYFNYLPIQGNKGEYIIIESSELKLESLLKSSVFIIPLGNDLYKVGASYERNFSDAKPTSEKRDYLKNKLDDVMSCDYKIIDQQAGIRPTVRDRRTIVGQHPKYKNLFISNGFGSRGILMAPTVSEQLIDFIENDKTLPPEIDCNRFNHLY
ncbi:NAD(P)/FAD-dependent oxidoreductase [Mesonia maritima]|uniref:Glycine/D-amino acid oxidase-like deaminating enzyme n=1 Tax=Mesonia maritima TaxID=1793873 RepID=A0ABU1K3Q8_9FLAO|nr:FAD-dependent oxidoreductase [Mesonia maritima]MDR6300228.1 glycine/D-amino acid oxidase-like deaminating enzyme [Mesonia maritima]